MILVAVGVLLLVVLAVAVYVTFSMNARASREDVIVSMRTVADDEVEFMRAFNGAAGRHAHAGNAVTVFQNGAEIFPPMLEAISTARSSVHFATSI
jgi:cardiolipin synthase A/B